MMCPLCPQNNLLDGPILAQTDDAYLIRASSSPKNFLIIPKEHVEEPASLPSTWWASLSQLLAKIPELDDYNISLNVGHHAGQRIAHLHFWIIPRAGGLPSSGKGMATLLADADK